MTSELEKLRAERDELHALVIKQFDDLAELRQRMAALGDELNRMRRLLRDLDLMRRDIVAGRHPLEWDRN